MTSINIFSMHTLPRPKIGLPNLDHFSYSEWPILLKKYLKRSLSIKFEENHKSKFFLKEPFPKPKIRIPNLDLH